MKRWPLGFLLVFALSAHAESYWDGNAAVQRGDAAFEAGMFAVSNAFARDTEILIEELASGKTTTARVTGRLDSQLDILVLLSPAAALPLDLEPGDVAFVRVTIRRTVAESAPILAEGTAPSADPDRTLSSAVRQEPAAAEAAETETEVAEAPAEPAEEPAVEPAAAEAAETETEVAEAPAEAPAEEPAVEKPEAAVPAGEAVTSAEDAAFLAGLAARTPQKQLFLPPREDEMFVYQEPVEPPAEVAAAKVEAVEPPVATAPTTEPVAEGATPEIVETLALAEPEAAAGTEGALAEPSVAVAEPPAAAAVTPAAPVAEPAVAEPAVAKPAEAQATAAAAKPEAVSTVLDLPGQGVFTWYLQLAAYSTEALARDTAARLSPTYPVLVLAPAAGAKALYRVFVGPLNKAESGTLLTYFRYRGFPDAFVRTAQK